jgi:hypothetical protein
MKSSGVFDFVAKGGLGAILDNAESFIKDYDEDNTMSFQRLLNNASDDSIKWLSSPDTDTANYRKNFDFFAVMAGKKLFKDEHTVLEELKTTSANIQKLHSMMVTLSMDASYKGIGKASKLSAARRDAFKTLGERLRAQPVDTPRASLLSGLFA